MPLVEHFIQSGYQVKASTTSAQRLPELTALNAEAFVVDINALSENIQSFLQSRILIINIPSKNVEGFNALIEEIQISAVEKIVFISSTSVYQDKNTILFEDDEAESHNSPLLIIEHLFRNRYKSDTTVVRFGGLIGYSRHPGKFFKNKRIVQDPDAYVNLIHRDDCIEIISQIVQQDVWGEVFNGCADTHPTKREFYSHACRLIGLPAPEFATDGAKSYKIISNQKLKKSLNYKFIHPDLMKIPFE